MQIIRTKKELRDAIKILRQNGKKIGFVPTMGALHKGHLSLIELARKHADKVVASIFVNPLQFGKGEDFDRYPRTEKEDILKLSQVDTDIVFLPEVKEIYPEGFCTEVRITKNTEILCGAFRNGHFDAVATIITKLLMMVLPDIAVFGEKDYQQLHIIRKLVLDLDIPVEIIGAPIMREVDGLAMSSRNAYLSETDRKIAPEIFQMLSMLRDRLRNGGKLGNLMDWGINCLKNKGFTSVDYLEARDSVTLELISDINRPARIFVAVWLGKTRLIDNIEI